MLNRSVHVSFLCLTMALSAYAQSKESDQPSPLAQLSDQTQALYHQVSAGVLRVQLPVHRVATLPAAAGPLAPWSDKLTPEVMARLQQSRPPGVTYIAEVLHSPSPVTTAPRQFVIFSPNVMGVVINSEGFALLPMYTSKEDVGNHALPVMLCNGTMTEARFVGSDEKSNITVVQVPHNAVRPLLPTTGPPAEGSLVMVMSMDPSATHLGVWTRWANNWGLVIRSTDGAIAGFSQHGHFLTENELLPLARQIIEHGAVNRPRLGVAIDDVPADDPQRQMVVFLGDLPAIRIMYVFPNSPASRAGLRPGDLILSLGKQSVGDHAGFAAAIAAATSGPTELKILRQDQIISVTVDLEAVLPQ